MVYVDFIAHSIDTPLSRNTQRTDVWKTSYGLCVYTGDWAYICEAATFSEALFRSKSTRLCDLYATDDIFSSAS